MNIHLWGCTLEEPLFFCRKRSWPRWCHSCWSTYFSAQQPPPGCQAGHQQCREEVWNMARAANCPALPNICNIRWLATTLDRSCLLASLGSYQVYSLQSTADDLTWLYIVCRCTFVSDKLSRAAPRMRSNIGFKESLNWFQSFLHLCLPWPQSPWALGPWLVTESLADKDPTATEDVVMWLVQERGQDGRRGRQPQGVCIEGVLTCLFMSNPISV